jgi:hypothetical protein
MTNPSRLDPPTSRGSSVLRLRDEPAMTLGLGTLCVEAPAGSAGSAGSCGVAGFRRSSNWWRVEGGPPGRPRRPCRSCNVALAKPTSTSPQVSRSTRCLRDGNCRCSGPARLRRAAAPRGLPAPRPVCRSTLHRPHGSSFTNSGTCRTPTPAGRDVPRSSRVRAPPSTSTCPTCTCTGTCTTVSSSSSPTSRTGRREEAGRSPPRGRAARSAVPPRLFPLKCDENRHGDYSATAGARPLLLPRPATASARSAT